MRAIKSIRHSLSIVAIALAMVAAAFAGISSASAAPAMTAITPSHNIAISAPTHQVTINTGVVQQNASQSIDRLGVAVHNLAFDNVAIQTSTVSTGGMTFTCSGNATAKLVYANGTWSFSCG